MPPVIFEIVAAIYVMDSLENDFSERRNELSLVLFITLKFINTVLNIEKLLLALNSVLTIPIQFNYCKLQFVHFM